MHKLMCVTYSRSQFLGLVHGCHELNWSGFLEFGYFKVSNLKICKQKRVKYPAVAQVAVHNPTAPLGASHDDLYVNTARNSLAYPMTEINSSYNRVSCVLFSGTSDKGVPQCMLSLS